MEELWKKGIANQLQNEEEQRRHRGDVPFEGEK